MDCKTCGRPTTEHAGFECPDVNPSDNELIADFLWAQAESEVTDFGYLLIPNDAILNDEALSRLKDKWKKFIVNESTRSPDCYTPTRKMLPHDDKLGAWMSAALEDAGVCEEMKKDIRDWFNTFVDES